MIYITLKLGEGLSSLTHSVYLAPPSSIQSLFISGLLTIEE